MRGLATKGYGDDIFELNFADILKSIQRTESEITRVSKDIKTVQAALRKPFSSWSQEELEQGPSS